jgi:hypothetical protein
MGPVSVPTVSSFSLPEWMAAFDRLKRVNAAIMGGKGGKRAPKRRPSKVTL